MCLSEARGTVDEKRVVAMPRPLGDREGGCMSEPVVRADHEGRKRVSGVEYGAADLIAAVACERRGGARALRAAAACPGTAIRRRGRGHEPDVDRPTHQMLERRADLRPKLVLEPLTRERVRHTDEEDVIFFGDHLGVLEPGVVRGARKPDLQLTERGRPQLP